MPPQEQPDRESRDLELTVMDTFGEDDTDDSTSETSTGGSEQGSGGGRGEGGGEDEEDGGEEPDGGRDPDDDPREEHEPDEGEEVEKSPSAQPQDKDYPKVKADKRGNLIDPRTGKVVAPAGPARRFYEELISSRQRQGALEGHIVEQRRLMAQAGAAIKDLKIKLEAREAQDTLPQQLGLSPDEHAEAIQIMSKFKNPATAMDAIKYVLTKAIQRGIDIKTLGLPANAGLDVGVLTQDIISKIENKLSPITNRLTASDEQVKQQEVVRTEINNFLSLNPEAKEYMPVLVKMAQQPELAHLSLQEAWLRLLLHLRSRQQPQRNSNQGNVGNGSNNPRMSRPSGRSRPGVDVDGMEVDNSPVNVNTEYKQLVREVVKDLGGLDGS